MKLSTRSRYGVRLMLALAERNGSGPVFLKDIAKRETISEKYLSLIVIPLRRAGLIRSTRGAHGGYTLAKSSAEITVSHIVDILEGESCVVDCVKYPENCPRVPTCPSRDIWAVLEGKIRETLSAVTLDDLVRIGREKAFNVANSQGDKEKLD
ncbi:MAG: HTH-type transcriptional regulator CymR [Syntrophus sp. SKADARSKE-3]|nr:HTH-type transcriptional regulator CymR [Syntrophus sp. SKADARSKE-3]